MPETESHGGCPCCCCCSIYNKCRKHTCIIAIVASIIGFVVSLTGCVILIINLPSLANHVDGKMEHNRKTYFHVGVTLLTIGGFLIITSICGCVLYCQCFHLFLKCCPAKSDSTRPDR